MAKVGWTVQSAFHDRNSHATRESSPSLCREAAQSNTGMHSQCTACRWRVHSVYTAYYSLWVPYGYRMVSPNIAGCGKACLLGPARLSCCHASKNACRDG